jgi:hypothetical protein
MKGSAKYRKWLSGLSKTGNGAEAQRLRDPSLGALAVFLRLGITGFGGPAAHIAMMRDEVVRRRGWLTDGPTAARSSRACTRRPRPAGWRTCCTSLRAGVAMAGGGEVVFKEVHDMRRCRAAQRGATMRKLQRAILSAVCITVLGMTMAHAVEPNTIKGTVIAVQGGTQRLVIRTTDDDIVGVELNDQTRFQRGGKSAALDDIEPGQHVTVKYTEEEDKKIATEVKLTEVRGHSR